MALGRELRRLPHESARRPCSRPIRTIASQWEVDLSQDDKVVIYRDPTRNLPEPRSYDRQLTIGMGCFLELLKIAASQTGHLVMYELFPEGESGPVAIATFNEGATPDPLFVHVLNRRSCKEPFAPKPVEPALLEKLPGFAMTVTDTGTVETLRNLFRPGGGKPKPTCHEP
ncbi:MAG: hypothetical protein R3D29_15660 [Nitratireductor sp.]